MTEGGGGRRSADESGRAFADFARSLTAALKYVQMHNYGSRISLNLPFSFWYKEKTFTTLVDFYRDEEQSKRLSRLFLVIKQKINLRSI